MSGLIPGGDTPSGSGAKGLFALDIQGQTPKYAHNRGERGDNYRDSLCRFFVSVAPSEMTLFRNSVADPVIGRPEILDRLAGDPRGAKGYIDFILQGAALPFKELIQVGQALSGDHVVYTFDQAPVSVPLQGIFVNTVQDDQATYFIRLYMHILRASVLARRQKLVSLKVDAYILTGILTDLTVSFENKIEVAVPFQMSLLLKRLTIVEYTQSWRPTSVGTPFATDLNAVPRDSRIVAERPIHTSTVRRPNDLDEEIERGETDARVGERSPNGDGRSAAQLALASASNEIRRLGPLVVASEERIALATTPEERVIVQREHAALQAQMAAAQTAYTRANFDLAQPAPTPNTAPTPSPAPLAPSVRSGPSPETH